MHFGNDGKNIRKFRQTVRDAWQRQVSAVYPEARADFDTTVVRLHASPAPLQRKLVSGAHLALVAPAPKPDDENGAASADIPCRFFAALTATLGPVEARAWFRDAVLEPDADAWRLVVPTVFKADWIRARYQNALERGRQAAGLDVVPDVIARSR